MRQVGEEQKYITFGIFKLLYIVEKIWVNHSFDLYVKYMLPKTPEKNKHFILTQTSPQDQGRRG